MTESTPKPRYSVPRKSGYTISQRWKYNEYRTEDGAAYLLLRDRSGEIVGEAIVDQWDLSRVLLRAHWARFQAQPGLYYVRGGMRGLDAPAGPKPQLYLHRFIVEAPEGSEVDHWNGNGLDCRRENLRITDHQGNAKNGRGHRRVRELETAMRQLLRCSHAGQACTCKRAALALLKVAS